MCVRRSVPKVRVLVKSRHPVVKLYLGDLEVDQLPFLRIFFSLNCVVYNFHQLTRCRIRNDCHKSRVKTSLEEEVKRR